MSNDPHTLKTFPYRPAESLSPPEDDNAHQIGVGHPSQPGSGQESKQASMVGD